MTTSGCVLVADQGIERREPLVRFLQERGNEVVVATTAEEAIDVIRCYVDLFFVVISYDLGSAACSQQGHGASMAMMQAMESEVHGMIVDQELYDNMTHCLDAIDLLVHVAEGEEATIRVVSDDDQRKARRKRRIRMV